MSQELLDSLDNALKRLVDREASISQADRQKASTTQNYLRQVLRARAGTDNTFPHLLQLYDEDFLGGSFARHTKNWPLDDIDLYIPLDGADLFYHNHGARMPFVIWSDDRTRPNRLATNAKWMTGSDIDPQKLVAGFREAIDETYPNSVTTLHSQAVNLQLSVAANSESDGISLDIVPCFHLSPEGGGQQFYLIPDHSGGWMRTNPRIDNELSAALHTYHHHTYRKAIRLVKYWNAHRLGGAFSSYYIELVICKKFDGYRTGGAVISSNTIALYWAFEAVRDSFFAGNLKSLVSGAPDIVAPLLASGQREQLNGVVGLVGSAYDAALTYSNLDLAFRYLEQLFGVGMA